MAKKDIKAKIVGFLQSQTVGATQVKISSHLEISRPTIQKYIQILHDEGEIQQVDVGGLSLWTVSDKKIYEYRPIKTLYNSLIGAVVRQISLTNPDVDFRKIGESISNEVAFENIVKIEQLQDLNLKILSDEKARDKFVGELLQKLMSIVFSLLEDAEVELIEAPNAKNFYTIRIGQSQFAETTNMFELMAGIIEKKLHDSFDITLRITIITHPAKKLVDFKFHLIDW